ncbi:MULTISPECIES: hypothetical protein [Streptosporangium]|uniref:Uncharacterized protein n=1 Tax=Streptosporangium brasiliense TaxID=47480 RepID=A0ABT9R1U3_9ACTN|nr:hypothetical protein [Streptosporangium brasiliense]MDP9862881.1 hypothetical protein [Streptosporangium brasiliense]
MNRRTLDLAVPMVFAAVMVLAAVFGAGGTAVRAVALVGGMAVAIYYAALRKNIKQ